MFKVPTNDKLVIPVKPIDVAVEPLKRQPETVLLLMLIVAVESNVVIPCTLIPITPPAVVPVAAFVTVTEL